jgi:parallel beta-helix repeat protein
METKDHSTMPGEKGPQSDESRHDDGLAPGTQLRHYKVTGPLRNSGTGRVYLALDLSSGERVAIKQAGPAKPRSERSAMEAQIVSQFHHPNAVRFIEPLEDESGTYLVFEYIEGMDIETFFEKTGPGPGEGSLRGLLLPIADAMEALHRAGFLHRDIKPANLRLRDSGTPVLIDFDAALPWPRAAAAGEDLSPVTDGYAAPELYSNDRPEGPWSDVYSLAALAYRAIAGSPPPAARARLAGQPMPPAVEVGADRYSGRFLAAIDAGLALSADERPASPALWIEAMGEAPLGSDDPDAMQTAPPRAAQAAAENRRDAAIPAADKVALYPPTLEVRRQPMGSLRKPPEEAPAAKDTSPGPNGAWGRRVAALIFLTAVIGAGGWFAWPYYLHNIKDTWVVDPSGSGDTTTISEALAGAKAGATLAVAPGTYTEGLNVLRPVTLLSSGAPGSAVIVAPESGPCLVVTARSGSISGLTFRGAAAPTDGADEAAVAAPGPTPVCVDIAGGSIRLESIQVSNPSGIGIRLQDGASAQLEAISVSDTSGGGVVFAEGAAGRLTDSSITRSGSVAIAVLGGAAPEISGNTITDSAAAGVLYEKGASGRFRDNSIAASTFSGIEVATAATPDIAGNRIVDSGQAGIYLRGAGPTTLTGNEIAGSGFTGILVASSAPVEIRNNTVEDSGQLGVLLLKGSRATLADNSVRNNKGYGIGIERGAEAELTDNLLEGNAPPQIQRDGEARRLPPAPPASGADDETAAPTAASD